MTTKYKPDSEGEEVRKRVRGKREGKGGRPAVRGVVEEGEGVLLVGEDNIEEDEAGDDDVLDGQPEEELQLGDAGEMAVGEVGADDDVEEDPVLGLGQARPLQEHLQPAIAGEVEGLDGLGQQPCWEAVRPEDVVDGLVGVGTVMEREEWKEEKGKDGGRAMVRI